MSQFELLKKLEYLVAFQANCLNEGNWDTFDKIEGEIEKLEKELLISRN
ncbi:hypothetical protein KJ761_00805 [Patescibacteria group bacterium]|nr:hypothetical protein [Patescibacteria group bacterium]